MCTASRRRAAWIWSPSPITIRSTARSNCSTHRPDARDVIVGEEVSCRLPGRRHRSASRRLRHDRGAASRAPAAAAQRLRRHRAPARGRRVLRAESPAAFLSRPDPARRYLRLLDEVPALEVRNGDDAAARTTRWSSSLPATAVAGRRRAPRRSSPAATRTRCGASARRGPRRRAGPRRFLASLRHGLGRPGGAHGGARDRRGRRLRRHRAATSPRSPASGRATCRGWRRAACLAFAAVSLPFQFMPLADRGERQVARSVGKCATPSAGCRRARMDVGVARRATRCRRRGVMTPRRHHRHRSGDGARRDARGELAPHAARASAAFVPMTRVRHRGLSQPRRRRGGMDDVDARLDAARATPPVARRSHRPARGAPRRSTMRGCSTAASIARASACFWAPARPICCGTKISIGPG